MNTYTNATVEIKLPAWIVSTINFFKLLKFWFTNPILTYRVVNAKPETWIPMLNLKGIEFMELSNGATAFRHKKFAGEFRHVIDEDTDMNALFEHLVTLWK